MRWASGVFAAAAAMLWQAAIVVERAAGSNVPQRLNTFPVAGCAGAPNTVSVAPVASCTAFDCTFPSNVTTTECPSTIDLGLQSSWGPYVVMAIYATATCDAANFTQYYATKATAACIVISSGIHALASCEGTAPTLQFCGSTDCSSCTSYSGTSCQTLPDFFDQNVVLSCQTGPAPTDAPTTALPTTAAPSTAAALAAPPNGIVLAVVAALVGRVLSAVAVY